ncbi:2-phosphosulfolactate phosphatase [Amycolatopsis pretoriensis]|uniref:Probable 2-phosphosulfolactate phosphatase n=1 Tax=Amycolatopsis pretoriensis TaxID=218821 RepID=A0A1H5R4B2_9PSEU|nr:2-phosphosulfolactate phosphatase [Amycolatopsis pretoriensis]SEF33223.1 2-phosphosulfolactate phosphatase [Amycolatopsis pretoriensis]
MGIREQSGYDVRLDWGGEGVAALGRECAVLVVVDVLSFSTTTDLVVGRGGRVLPVRWRDERGIAHARAAGAVIAGEGAFTLRPSSVTEIPPGTLLALPSPNGATLCDAAAATGAHVLAGCLRNASAVAAKALELGGPVGLIAAGERWGVDIFGGGETFGPLRPCVEDQMGAGAIAAALAGLGAKLSPEAALAARSVDVGALASCVSGRELTEAGHGGDVALASRRDVSDAAPMRIEGVLA